MPVLNHHIVAARDKNTASLFFAEILGLDQPATFGEFALLKVSADTTLDFIDTDADIAPLHYAFLVTEAEFDDIFARITERRLSYWYDPSRRDEGNINHWDDGRGSTTKTPTGTSSRPSPGLTEAAGPKPNTPIPWLSHPSNPRLRLGRAISGVKGFRLRWARRRG